MRHFAVAGEAPPWESAYRCVLSDAAGGPAPGCGDIRKLAVSCSQLLPRAFLEWCANCRRESIFGRMEERRFPPTETLWPTELKAFRCPTCARIRLAAPQCTPACEGGPQLVPLEARLDWLPRTLLMEVARE